MFAARCGWIAAMDMVDCFHHLPCSEAPVIWDRVAAFWTARHVSEISVPLRKGGGAGKLGRYCEMGWQCFPLPRLLARLAHFSLTNFVALPGLLGPELRGAPMGDALSGAVLRLFKWEWDSSQRPMEYKDTVSMRSSCSKLVHLNGSNMLVLDVSFRDDLRTFCIWDGTSSGIDKRRASQWATARLRARYCSGTMALEETGFQTFIGFHIRFGVDGLLVAPAFPDPIGASLYHTVDLRILQPWSSWNPRSQKVAIIKGWLCRIFYLSSCSQGEIASI